MRRFFKVVAISLTVFFCLLSFSACSFDIGKTANDVITSVSDFFNGIFGINGTKTEELPSDDPDTPDVSPVNYTDLDLEDSDVSVHFIELGNKYTGDSVLIKTGNTEILIDCGSKTSSIPTVSAYINNFVTDGILEYVIVTHAHEDHYAGFATSEKADSIFDLYDCRTIITFANTNKKETATMQKNFLRELNDEVVNGAVHYTADKCYNQEDGAKRIYPLENGYELEILYNKYYFGETSSTENDYSVCCMIQNGEKHFLFTGDLEEKGEASLADKYKEDYPEIDYSTFSVDLYKAGHHGSKTSSTVYMLDVFKPKTCCVCCCAGSPEYTKTNENQFPTQIFVNNISRYTTQVFVTTLCVDYDNNEFKSFNGNIVILAKGEDFSVKCSDNNTPLKDTEWFKSARICPDKWKETENAA